MKATSNCKVNVEDFVSIPYRPPEKSYIIKHLWDPEIANEHIKTKSTLNNLQACYYYFVLTQNNYGYSQTPSVFYCLQIHKTLSFFLMVFSLRTPCIQSHNTLLSKSL